MNMESPTKSRSGICRSFLTELRTRTDVRVLVPLVAILLAAAVLRFIGLDWDNGQHLHPDERFLTMVENAIQIPSGIGQYFDAAHSPLNPYNNGFDSYVYGTLPLFIVRVVGELLHRTDYAQIYLVGRALSALADLGTIVLAFLIARRLYGRQVALLAACLHAFTVLSIQQSHFFTVDGFTTFFVVLTFYFAVRLSQGGGWWSMVALGVTLGAALASKVSIFLFVGVVVVAIILRFTQSTADGDDVESTAEASSTLSTPDLSASRRLGSNDFFAWLSRCRRNALFIILALGLVGVATFLSFRVFQPYAFTGYSLFDLHLNAQWLKDMDWIAKITNGEIDYPPNHQWAARTAYLYPLQNMINWGMGPLLGICAWLGVVWAIFELLWRRYWRHVLPVVWILLLFGYQGGEFVKYMRYFLPIYPFLVMLAAYILVSFWERGRSFAIARQWRPGVLKAAKPLAALTMVAVVLSSVLWSCAFVSVYTRPLSRVVASDWIYDNVPAKSTLTYEIWDDSLPLSLDPEHTPARYTVVGLPLYDDDNTAKLNKLVSLLDQTDYVILSSDRVIGSISRLPMRYPLTMEYYQSLLDGSLGFELVATFTSYPSLFGWQINDGGAEESFTVYEHPQVRIFQKTAAYSHQNSIDLLSQVALDDVVHLKPAEVANWKNGAMMTASERLIQSAGGTWSAIFQRDGLVNRIPVLVWYLVVQLLGLLAFPLTFVLFRNLRDRGYALSKALGVLVVAYLSWLVASLKTLPFAPLTIGLAILLLAVLSGIVWLRRRSAIRRFIADNRRLILVNEALFAAFFIMFLLIRYGNPDLWHPIMGGEKPMDFAFLNAIIKSTYFPPYDPWFAGGYIDYYYFGQVIVATLTKLTGIVPAVAYNLAIPWLFALTAMGAFCVTFNLVAELKDRRGEADRANSLVGPLLGGLLGAIFVVVAGNLGEVKLAIPALQQASHVVVQSTIPGLAGLVKAVAGLANVISGGQQLPVPTQAWYWDATRVMPNFEINEFPFFTFLYADLHAHLIALPFTLLTLGVILNLTLHRDRVPGMVDWFGHRLQREWLWWAGGLLVAALVLGELRVNNTWDFPTYGLLLLGGLLIGEWQRRRRFEVGLVVVPLVMSAVVLLLSSLLFWPFLDRYVSGYSSFEHWSGSVTSLADFLTIKGFFLFVIVTFLGVIAFGRGSRYRFARLVSLLVRRIGPLPHVLGLLRATSESGPWLVSDLAVAVVVGVLMVFLAWLGLPLVAFLLPFIVVAAILLLRPQASPAERFVLLLIEAGFCLMAALELVVLKGDIGRMNTIFKFYLQTWVWWGIAAAVALVVVARSFREWRPWWRRLWQGAFALLLVAVLLYPIMASSAKVQDRFVPGSAPGLDGMAYMTSAVQQEQGSSKSDQPIALVDDYEAINWLLDNVQGSPVVLEAPGDSLYHWNSRVSVYTGLPTVIGWDWHEKQQRSLAPGDSIDQRITDVETIYTDGGWNKAVPLLQKYHVVYIYVGKLEQIKYPGAGLDKFDAAVGNLLDRVYQNRSVTIYRLRGA